MFGGRKNLLVVIGSVKAQDEHKSLLTGRACGYVPVVLRQMFLLVPIWLGETVTILLPLERSPRLAVWQYLRMLRPWMVFLLFCWLGVHDSGRDLKPGSRDAQIAALGTIAAGVGLWIALEILFHPFEFVRLINRFNSRPGTIKIRFSTEELANRAREVLVTANKAIAQSSREERVI